MGVTMKLNPGISLSARSMLLVLPAILLPLTVNCGGIPVAPMILAQPMDQSVQAGGSASFSVTVVASPAATYQWHRNGSAINGATQATLSLSSVKASDNEAKFYVVATNNMGTVTSSTATLRVTGQQPDPNPDPDPDPNPDPDPVQDLKILQHPLSLSVAEGESASFAVVASGKSNTYQWLRNGSTISGATSATYTLKSAAKADDAAKFSVKVSNGSKSLTSNAATLSVKASQDDVPVSGPAIIQQPVDQTAAVGGKASFTVKYTGNPKPEVHWMKVTDPTTGDADDIQVTTDTLTFTSVKTSDAGLYRARVCNDHGCTFTTDVKLTVSGGNQGTAPAIVQQPSNQSIQLGGSATFTVKATGSPAPSFQWKRNGNAIQGATSASYSVKNAQSTDDGARFSCFISNTFGNVTSDEAVLNVGVGSGVAPAIITQPMDAKIKVGESAEFSVKVTGTPAPTFQWRKNGVNVKRNNSGTFVYENAQASDDGAKFDVVVTNSAGSVTSNVAYLNVVQETGAAPSITRQPASQKVSAGETAVFSVVATGTPSPKYQWRKNGESVDGATGSSFSLSSVSSADDGAIIDVLVYNTVGKLISNPATLTVGAGSTATAPTISSHPSSKSVTAGSSVTFSVSASGSPTPSYQWLRNGDVISGATRNSYTLSNTTLDDDGSKFSVEVSNAGGSVTSREALLTVSSGGNDDSGSGSFTVTFVADAGGSLSGTLTQKVSSGGSCSPVTANASSGYAFNFWYGDGVATTTGSSLTLSNVTKNMTVRASFASTGKGSNGAVGANILGIDSKGAKVALSDFFGKVILLDVSTIWCGPCNSAAPGFEATYKKYKGQGLECVTVLAQNASYKMCSQADLQSWVNKYSNTMRVMGDSAGTSAGPAQRFYVSATGGFPTFAVLDKQFKVRYLGNSEASALSAALNLL